MAKGLGMTKARGDSISGIKEIDRALSKLEKKITNGKASIHS